MADFEIAYDHLIDKWEDCGRTGRITTDRGGVTKYGISSKAFPRIEIKDLTIPQAQKLTKDNYWQFDEIKDQRIANKFLSICFNTGLATGIDLVHSAILGAYPQIKLEPTSKMTVDLAVQINMLFAPTILMMMSVAQLTHYRERYGGLKNIPSQLIRRAQYTSLAQD